MLAPKSERTCPICKTTFFAKSDKIFCSYLCKSRGRGLGLKKKFAAVKSPDPWRFVGRQKVYTSPSGSVYTLRGSGSPRYVRLGNCERCRKEFVGWTPRHRFCGNRCGKRSKWSTKSADQLFSKLVRTPGVCLRCGTTEGLQCAHVWSRSYHAIRHDYRNAVSLCSKCHLFMTHHPIEWDEWCEKNLGPIYRELRVIARQRLTTAEKEVLFERLHNEWGSVQAGGPPPAAVWTPKGLQPLD